MPATIDQVLEALLKAVSAMDIRMGNMEGALANLGGGRPATSGLTPWSHPAGTPVPAAPPQPVSPYALTPTFEANPERLVFGVHIPMLELQYASVGTAADLLKMLGASSVTTHQDPGESVARRFLVFPESPPLEVNAGQLAREWVAHPNDPESAFRAAQYLVDQTRESLRAKLAPNATPAPGPA